MQTIDFNTARLNSRKVIFVCFLTFGVSGCVSSTLTTVEPAAPTSVLSLSAEEQKTNQLRSEGIAEIHAKADAVPHNAQAPAYGVPRKGETPLLTPEEIKAKTNQMKVTTAKANSAIPDAEILASQRKLNALRKKGNSHYNSALKKIEN